MPHLSPISWAFVPILFWFVLILFMSINWWHSMPSAKVSNMFPAPSFKSKWNWY